MTHRLWLMKSLNMTGGVGKKIHIDISARQINTGFQATMAGQVTRLDKLRLRTVYPLAVMCENMASNSSCHESEKHSRQAF